MSQRRPTAAELSAYCESYLLQNNMSAGFRAAFPNTTASKDNVSKAAYKFHHLPEVSPMLAKLEGIARKKAEEKFGVSAETITKALAQVLTKGLRSKIDKSGNQIMENPAAVVSAAAELNRMAGNHAASKIAVGGDPDGAPLIATMSDDDLKKKLAAYGIKR